MKDKNLHNDTFEDFYKSAFDEAEMEIPAGLTNSLMDQINPPKTPTKLSDKIGASKLYRLLQASLLLNLVTVSMVAYYLTNDSTSTLEIKTPVNEIIIEQKEKHTEPIITEQETTSQEIQTTPAKQATTTPKPVIQKSSVITTDTILTTTKQDTSSILAPVATPDLKAETEEPVKQEAPQDLDALRKTLQDSTKGKSLFDKK